MNETIETMEVVEEVSTNEVVDLNELNDEVQDQVLDELETNPDDVKVFNLDGKTVAAITVAGVTVVIAAWEGGKWIYKKGIKPLAQKAWTGVKNLFAGAKAKFEKKPHIVVAETTTPDGDTSVQAATPVAEEQKQ